MRTSEGRSIVGSLGGEAREAKLRWFGREKRRDGEYISRRMLRLELPGRRAGRRAEKRFMEQVKEGMKLGGVREEHRGEGSDGGA